MWRVVLSALANTTFTTSPKAADMLKKTNVRDQAVTGQALRNRFYFIHINILLSCFFPCAQHVCTVGPECGKSNKRKVSIKRSRVLGVMVTQFMEEVPEGMSTPDFTRKPITLTIQEGKFAFFKAVVTGDPKPEVTWSRAKSEMLDSEKFQSKCNPNTGEYILEIHKVCGEDADTYKCFAVNEFGKAVCTATLNVIEVGLKRQKAKNKTDGGLSNDPAEFRKMLRKRVGCEKAEKKEAGLDGKFWEVLLGADRKEYERICAEYGVTDFRWMLRKLSEMRRNGEEEQSKDGVTIPYNKDMSMKPSIMKVVKKPFFTVNSHQPEDAELQKVDVDEVNVFSTEIKIPPVDFVVRLQNAKAKEREDGFFECVLSHPLSMVKWIGKHTVLEDGEKYRITVSEDKMFHQLIVKDCMLLDKGIYTAVAGINTCSAWLVVEADMDPGMHEKEEVRQTPQAGGAEGNLEAVTQKQLAMLQKEGQNKNGGIEPKAEIGQAGSPDHDEGKGQSLSLPYAIPGEKSNNQDMTPSESAQSGAECSGGNREADGSSKGSWTKQSPLTLDVAVEQGVCFTCGLSNVRITAGQPAELTCKLSSPKHDRTWYKDGKQLISADTLTISRSGASHSLRISHCHKESVGKYRFEAGGCKTEALVTVKDPPKFKPDDLERFLEPTVVRAGQSATFRMPFAGQDLTRVQWYKDGEELLNDTHIRLEKTSNQSCLHISKCQRKDAGEIKFRVKNEYGVAEVISRLIVLDKPTHPQGTVEVVERSASCIEIKWKPPKDDGGSLVKGYVLERQQVVRNTWKKLGSMATMPVYKDTDVDHGRKYRYRIQALNEEGVSEAIETEEIMAGTKAILGPPAAPKVVSTFKDCINLSWMVPANTSGFHIVGYNLEKRKKGSNLWSQVNLEEPIRERKYAVKNVIAGMEYEFRVIAVSLSGASEPSVPSECVFTRDPKKPPGMVMDLRVTDSNSTTLSLAWTKPTVEEGFRDEATGYFVEVQSVASTIWKRCNNNPIATTSFMVKGLKPMGKYWVRVIAINKGGDGEPQQLCSYIMAMPPTVRPKFTTANMNTFMVVKAGNSVRVNVNFEASPLPDVIWLKDNVPVSQRVTISNTERASQLLIPTSERSDTGVYTITIKNLVGQETFSIEIRITDAPMPPGPVALKENVLGTVTVTWEPSPDEKHDDHLHYMVSKRDSSKAAWHIVADHLFNNKLTVCSLVPGHEYHFRIHAKNDMGLSDPSESPAWRTAKKKDKFVVNVPEQQARRQCSAPSFLVLLKERVARLGYECRMSCAVGGHPAPCITWRRGCADLHPDPDHYISNTCGVCSMLIFRVGPEDAGEYTVTAKNDLGRVECSARLTVRE